MCRRIPIPTTLLLNSHKPGFVHGFLLRDIVLLSFFFLDSPPGVVPLFRKLELSNRFDDLVCAEIVSEVRARNPIDLLLAELFVSLRAHEFFGRFLTKSFEFLLLSGLLFSVLHKCLIILVLIFVLNHLLHEVFETISLPEYVSELVRVEPWLRYALFEGLLTVFHDLSLNLKLVHLLIIRQAIVL